MSNETTTEPSQGLPGHVRRRVQMVLLGLWIGWEAWNTYRGLNLGGRLALHLALAAMVGWLVLRYFQHQAGSRRFGLVGLLVDAVALSAICVALCVWLIQRQADGQLVSIALKSLLSPALAWVAVVMAVRDREKGLAWGLAILPGSIVLAHGFLNAALGVFAE